MGYIKLLLFGIGLFSFSLGSTLAMDFGTSNRMAWLNSEYLKRYKCLPKTTAGGYLAYTDLSFEVLFEADLKYTKFYEANLSFCDLEKATLKKANLMMANLQSANLKSSNLYKAFLVGTNCSNADFTQAILIKANFNTANLRNTNLTKAKITFTDLSGADLRGAYHYKKLRGKYIKIPVTLKWLDEKGAHWKDSPILQ